MEWRWGDICKGIWEESKVNKDEDALYAVVGLGWKENRL